METRELVVELVVAVALLAEQANYWVNTATAPTATF